MRDMRKFLVVLILGLLGCSTTPPAPRTQELSLNELETLQLGTVTKEDILKKFGEPIVQLTNEKEKSVSWLYFFLHDPQKQRASFVFDGSSQVLKEIDWFVYQNDNERNPAKALARYSNGKFKKHDVQWQIADSISSKDSYIDNQLGIEITARDDHPDETSMIAFAAPGSIKEQDGFLGLLKNQWQQQGDWRVIVDRRELRSPANSK